jgi:hypothetical protein
LTTVPSIGIVKWEKEREKMKATFDVTKKEWEREWKTRKPEIYITVKDAKPHVMLLKAGSYLDVTDLIPSGRDMAEIAVRTFAGRMPNVGWFPTSVEIKNTVKGREKEIIEHLTSTGQAVRRL